MTTHQLAKLLLERPDVDVSGNGVGQGSMEGADGPLYGAIYRKVGDEAFAQLVFFDPEYGGNRRCVPDDTFDEFWGEVSE